MMDLQNKLKAGCGPAIGCSMEGHAQEMDTARTSVPPLQSLLARETIDRLGRVWSCFFLV